MIPFLFSFSIDDARLADEVSGVYTGLLAKDGQLDKTFSLQVTKISDDMVEVVANDGKSCRSFKAKVWEDNLSSIRIIRLEPTEGIILKSGMMTPANGRLSYGVSTVGSDKIEVFSGIKK